MVYCRVNSLFSLLDILKKFNQMGFSNYHFLYGRMHCVIWCVYILFSLTVKRASTCNKLVQSFAEISHTHWKFFVIYSVRMLSWLLSYRWITFEYCWASYR